ncbi:hypothetical protein SDC9_199016 [bioreactor metagenome]|uniref:Uncharacterized protein n=1 Tax=bioreactor metagenome TaxID=1076179 RepID=A0A645IW12_9ZZZZ
MRRTQHLICSGSVFFYRKTGAIVHQRGKAIAQHFNTMLIGIAVIKVDRHRHIHFFCHPFCGFKKPVVPGIRAGIEVMREDNRRAGFFCGKADRADDVITTALRVDGRYRVTPFVCFAQHLICCCQHVVPPGGR